jgi:hypothetical protein
MAHPAGAVAGGKTHRIRWDERSGAAANARRYLPLLAGRYFADMRRLLADDPPPAELHPLRLETKRFRYTLELFRACYGPGLETRVAGLRRIQQALGDVNDGTATWRLLEKRMEHSPQRARVERFLAERAAEQALDFRKEWAAFDAPGQELRWTTYLARNARTPARRA